MPCLGIAVSLELAVSEFPRALQPLFGDWIGGRHRLPLRARRTTRFWNNAFGKIARIVWIRKGEIARVAHLGQRPRFISRFYK